MNIKIDRRPWGFFEQYTQNEISTVKILTIKTGQKISLQVHKNRSEFWKVLKGNPVITVGDKIKDCGVGESLEIPPNTEHRIEAKKNDVEVLEIAFGQFDEGDIVRLKDDYGR